MTHVRRDFPKAIKRAAFKRSGGFCEGLLPNDLRCSTKLDRGVEYDHATPDYMGGEPTLENCICLCSTCHRLKTGNERKVIDKTRRIRDRVIYGIKPKRTITKWRRFDGSIVQASRER